LTNNPNPTNYKKKTSEKVDIKNVLATLIHPFFSTFFLFDEIHVKLTVM